MKSILTFIVRFTLCVALLHTAHAEELVGSIPGQLSVQQGAAVYTIPIEVPPGVAGMQPDLAITYNSNAGNGLLGVGFSLSGLSAITRCGQTIAQDGRKGGVYYDARDRFCLDGQRLIAVSGSDGGNGTEYRTEIDGYSKIVSHGQQGSGPAWWRVRTKSGQVMEFGNTADSRIEAQGKSTVRLWAVNRIADTVGNRIDFKYHEDNGNGEYYPTRILYAGNSVEFEYGQRQDMSSIYQVGGRIRIAKRLTTLLVQSNNVSQWNYLINYVDDDKKRYKTRLKKVERCDAKGKCTDPIQISWVSEEFGGSTPSRWLHYGSNNAWHRPRNGGGGSDYVSLIDMNGDGLPDHVYELHPQTGAKGMWVAINTEEGFNSPTRWLYYGSNNAWHRPRNGNGDSDYVSLIDMNGDGLPDHIYDAHPNGEKGMWVAINTGDGFESPTRWLHYGNNNAWHRPRHGSGGSDYISLIDMNGDGLPDHVYDVHPQTGAKGMWVAINTGEDFESPARWLHYGSNNAWHRPRNGSGGSDYISLVDMNGDGLPDHVYDVHPQTGARGMWIAINTGEGFESPARWLHYGSDNAWHRPRNGSGGSDYISLVDMNGDGLPDHVYDAHPNGEKGMWVAINTGEGFEPPARWLHYGSNNAWHRPRNGDGGTDYISLIDINGDGLPDHVYDLHPQTGAKGMWVALNKGSKKSLVQKIKNAFGNAIELTYESVTWPELHEIDRVNLSYPIKAFQAPGYFVVTEVRTDNNISGKFNTTTYRYGGLKANLHGRGSLGFRWIEATDHTNNTVTRTEYNQTFPHVGGPERVTTHLIDGSNKTLLSDASTQYGHATTPGANANNLVYAPRATQTIEKTHGLDGSLLTTVTTQNDAFDAFGNIERMTVTTRGAGKTHTKISTNDYVNDQQRWILGRLTRASVTHIAPDGSRITRASAFTYDAQTGLLTAETLSPNTPLARTTRYQYDQYGNKVTVTLSASGLADRATRTQYDNLGRFPIRVTNALGHAETRQYHSACGKPVSLTGPNGLATRWEYDSLCRKTREVRADGTQTTWNYRWASQSSNNGAPALARYSLTETASGAPPVTVWYDALNREVRKDTTGFDGKTIHQETQYNAKGQITRQSLPHFALDPAHWVSNTYDAIGRPATVTRPAGRLTGQGAAVTRYAYSGFTTTVTDPMGRRKTTTKNALGQVVRVDEEEGVWLTHTHDAIGNLVETNAGGAVTRMGYDLRGNKVRMEDPDMGRWEYTYNGFGELVAQRDAKGQLVAMAYDALGRMVRRTEPEGVTTWQYDSAGKGIGKLAWTQAPGGFRKEFAYDALGRPAATTTHADNQSFAVATRYDQLGRVAESVRPGSAPGGLTVQHVYNASGYLESLRIPREQILDYDTAHLHTLYQNTREMAALLLDETTNYLQKAAEYRAKADVYRQLADQERLYARALALLQQAQAQMQANAEPGAVFAPINAARELIRPLAETALQADRFPELATTLEGVARDLATAAAQGVAELDAKLAQLESWGQELTRIGQQMARMDHDPYHLYLWQAKGRDAAGRLTGTLFGNGLTTNKVYDPATGELISIQSGFGTESPIRNLGYTYDLVDNVTARLDRAQGIQEYFQYDRLDRLTTATVTGQIGQTSYNHTRNYTYDIQGNMTHNSGVGGYLYGAAGAVAQPGPHAVMEAGNQEIQYDANGSMTRAGDRAIAWTSFNKPKSFQRGGKTIAFDYGPDRARYRKVGTTTGGNTQRTIYLGKLFEQETTGDTVRRKHFIYADGQLVAIHIKTEEGGVPQPDETRYLHRDNLGSIDTITDGRGNIVERMSYEAFGQRRAGNWRAADDPLAGFVLPAFTNRGFTGHEHVDEMDFVHMNGRVYDPRLGRFLSADPNIQAPYSSQSYNRYSYVLNNPLKYTDPSGFFWKKVKKAVKKARKAVKAAFRVATAPARETFRFIKKYKREIIAIGIVVGAWYAGGLVGNLVKNQLGKSLWGKSASLLADIAVGNRITATGFTYMQTGSFSQSFKAGYKAQFEITVEDIVVGAAFGELEELNKGSRFYENTAKGVDLGVEVTRSWGDIREAAGKERDSLSARHALSASATNRRQAARAWELTAQTPAHAGGAMANRRWFGHGARNRNNARRFQRALRVSYF